MLRYQSWAKLFNAEGIGVIGFDIRGHGKSKGMRGDSNYRYILRDIDCLIHHSHQAHPFVPKILYGHGMGGNFVIKYAIDFQPPLVGIISASPWLRLTRPYSDWLLIFSKFFRKVVPILPILKWKKSNYFSRDNVVIEHYNRDPLVHRRITPRFFESICNAGTFIMKNKHKLNLPLLLMHGSEDRITAYRATSDFALFTSDSTTLKIWEGAYHELHNEFERHDIFAYILQWIESFPAIHS